MGARREYATKMTTSQTPARCGLLIAPTVAVTGRRVILPRFADSEWAASNGARVSTAIGSCSRGSLERDEPANHDWSVSDSGPVSRETVPAPDGWAAVSE